MTRPFPHLETNKLGLQIPESESMEEITDGVNNMNLAGDSQKKNRIQVSNTKKPLFFYVNLAKVSIVVWLLSIQKARFCLQIYLL